jgi:hypothetical protein
MVLKPYQSAAGNMLDGQQRDKKLTSKYGVKSLIISNEVKGLPVSSGVRIACARQPRLVGQLHGVAGHLPINIVSTFLQTKSAELDQDFFYEVKNFEQNVQKRKSSKSTFISPVDFLDAIF